MLNNLKQREATGNNIRVGLIGAGAMGVGIAWQVAHTPGMELVFVADLNRDAATRAVEAANGQAQTLDNARPAARRAGSEIIVTEDALSLLSEDMGVDVDVVVESTNTIGAAARYCLAAIQRKAHVVLMNAEVDLALGPLLQHEAEKQGVVVTSDAGDQHGVLARMMDEIELWGFRLVQAGNIKGFLNRYATAEMLRGEAAKRNLNPIQCCAYTDGTKLNIEMAIISNARNMPPFVDGMEGPACEDVREAITKFNFDAYDGVGHVDYILGAEPGGGVYVVGHCDNPLQGPYLEYYKLGKPPYYLFYRPYHLCHLETTRAIAMAELYGKAVLTPAFGRVADVYAQAKRDLKTGQVIAHGIGGDEFYGLIKPCAHADADGQVPIALLESENGAQPKLRRDLPKDGVLCIEDIQLPDTYLNRLFARQNDLISAGLASSL